MFPVQAVILPAVKAFSMKQVHLKMVTGEIITFQSGITEIYDLLET